jgi:integrase
MRGTIVTRSPGHHSIVLDKGRDPVTGKRRQEWIAVKGNYQEAEDQLDEMIHQLKHGNFIKPTKLTVREHFNQWLDSYVAPNLSPATVDLYRSVVKKHVLPSLGDIVLTELKPHAIQKIYSEKLKSGLSNRTVQIIHSILHKGLENAVKTGLILRNPMVAVECPKSQRPEMITMNETDIHLLLEFARSSPYYSLFYTLLFTGMRRSEALALKWADVDLLLLKVSVNKSLSYMNTPKDGSRILLKQPKTKKSRRNISITPSNAVVLREHHQKQDEMRQSLGQPLLKDDDFVFSNMRGKPYLPNSVTHAWIKLVRRCGLKGIKLHSARHSHASLLMKQGVHPKIVQERLGHASISTTLDLYSHVVPGLQEAAAMKFDEIIIGSPKSAC